MKNFVILLCGALVLSSCLQNNPTKQPDTTSIASSNDTLTKSLEQAYEKEAIVGFAVAVVDAQGPIYSKGFGYKDINQKDAYTATTIQNIASISKTLIGVSLLKAQEMGALRLEDPISKYVPFPIKNPHHPEKPILLKHLAYHTSSITDLDEVYSKSYVLKKSVHDENEGVYEWFSKPEDKVSLEDYLKYSLTEDGKWHSEDMFLQSEPGAQREYSNIGSALCSYVIEKATGTSYEAFTKEHIFLPLQMKASGWSSKDIDSTNRSRLFAHKDMMIAEYSLITKADGGFITSSTDLGIFLSELIKGYKGSGTLLSKESYQQLFERHTFATDTDEKEEVGVFMEFSNELFRISDTIVGHDGSDPGVTTAMYFNPKTEIGRIMITNTDSDFNDSYWPEIQDIWKALLAYEAAIVASKK